MQYKFKNIKKKIIYYDLLMVRNLKNIEEFNLPE